MNHRAVRLATFKYLSLLRSSKFPPWYQQEISTINATRFRFQEKRRPDDYAGWITEHLAWPVPRELIISGAKLVWPWDEAGEGEREMRDILNSFRVGVGRSVLMGRKEEHEKLGGDEEWKKEPVYGTLYKVARVDEEFFKEVRESLF